MRYEPYEGAVRSVGAVTPAPRTVLNRAAAFRQVQGIVESEDGSLGIDASVQRVTHFKDIAVPGKRPSVHDLCVSNL